MESFLLLLVLVALFTAGVSYSRASKLSRRIAAIEQYLATEQEPMPVPVPVSSPVPTQTTTLADEGMGADIRKPRPHVAPAPAQPSPQNQPILEPSPPARPLLEPVVQRIRSTEEWETLIGGRWMNRIGALALILGIGFFLKYAFDNNWISQGLRVVIGLAIGMGLLAWPIAPMAETWRSSPRASSAPESPHSISLFTPHRTFTTSFPFRSPWLEWEWLPVWRCNRPSRMTPERLPSWAGLVAF